MSTLWSRPSQDQSVQEFDSLETLRHLLDETLSYAEDSLQQYRDETSGGWYHLLPSLEPKPPGDFSRASSATCLAFARAARIASPTPAEAQNLLDRTVETNWSSAGLDEDNPFTVSFLLEALDDLIALGGSASEEQLTRIRSKIVALKQAFEPS